MLSNELTRRHLIKRATAFSAGFAGLHLLYAAGQCAAGEAVRALLQSPDDDAGKASKVAEIGYGPLTKDAAGIIDLPLGFSYAVIARRGDLMNDGLLVPGQPDAMATFPGSTADRVILVCNHELSVGSEKWSAFGKDLEHFKKIDPSRIYDAGAGITPPCGGTTTIVYNVKERKKEKQFLSLAGTINNCAGGAMPWGAWLSCEEDASNAGPLGSEGSKRDGALEKNHGYVFEVAASEAMELAIPRPIPAMGRFKHEACCMDTRSGVVYLTEDRADGILYRYLPKNKTNLHEGGTLQAMVVRDRPSLNTSNLGETAAVKPGEPMAVSWMNLDEIDAPKDDLRHRGFAAGAASFSRNEGMWFGNDCVYFAATTGGKKQKGQLWKYYPSAAEGSAGEEAAPGKLELFVEPNDGAIIENADNVTVAPWGDLIVCEDEAGDGDGLNHLVGVTPQGKVYKLGKNAMSDSEFAGATFSPDGSTLFVNIQTSGLTLAITGPWKSA